MNIKYANKKESIPKITKTRIPSNVYSCFFLPYFLAILKKALPMLNNIIKSKKRINIFYLSANLTHKKIIKISHRFLKFKKDF